MFTKYKKTDVLYDFLFCYDNYKRLQTTMKTKIIFVQPKQENVRLPSSPSSPIQTPQSPFHSQSPHLIAFSLSPKTNIRIIRKFF